MKIYNINSINYNLFFVRNYYGPLYIISEDGKYERYRNEIEAAQKNNMTPSAISKAISGEIYTTKGKIVVRSDEIEDDEGKIDKIKFNRIIQRFARKAIYAFKADGSIKKYRNSKEAISDCHVNSNSFYKNLKSEHPRKTNNTVFRKSCDVTLELDDGSLCLDDNKIKAIYDKFENLPGCPLEKIPVCIITDNKIFKYDSINAAAKSIGAATSEIRACISNERQRYTTKGVIVVKASDIEIKNKDGSISFDEEKITQYKMQAYEAKKRKYFYNLCKYKSYGK